MIVDVYEFKRREIDDGAVAVGGGALFRETPSGREQVAPAIALVFVIVCALVVVAFVAVSAGWLP